MKRTPIAPDLGEYPREYYALMTRCDLYDSSCSPEARVIFLDRDGGYYLKSAPKNSLKTEADLNRYFHEKGLGPEVLSYASYEMDWLLTRRVEGEDCTHPEYLQNPERLCDTLAVLLRQLHETPAPDCPVPDRMKTYRETARIHREEGVFDGSFAGGISPEAAWRIIEAQGHLLRNEVLLHGDYCLPNIMLKNWDFSGFIDLGNGGVGDRHIDLFWGAWTLNFNLKTDRYRQRFFDAYGRDKIDPALIATVAAYECFG